MARRPRRFRRAAWLVAALACAACGTSLIDLSATVAAGGRSSLPTVVFLTHSPIETMPPEEAAAWAWLSEHDDFDAELLSFIDLDATRLPDGAVLWWHYADDEALPAVAVRDRTLAIIRSHLRGGGSMLLSLIAATWTVPLELESSPPDIVSRRAALSAVGAEVAGYQSRGHPLLARFWGGVLPAANPGWRATAAAAWSGSRQPHEGLTWGVHKTERGVEPGIEIGVEYRDAFGGGATVVTLGAHCYFADAGNRNRAQLEQLVADTLRYLDRQPPAVPTGASLAEANAPGTVPPEAPERHYWEPTPAAFVLDEVARAALPPTAEPQIALNLVERSRSGLEIRRFDDRATFTLSTPRALLQGTQLGRIDEFRVHPRALLSALRFGIVRPGRGITWLDAGAGSREFTARPEGDELYYNDGEVEIRLHLTVDRRYPAMVALMTVRSPAAIDLLASWRVHADSALRADGSDPGPPRVGWDEGAQAFVWRSADGFAAKAGFGRPTPRHLIGFRPDEHLNAGGLVVPATVPTASAATDNVAPAPGAGPGAPAASGPAIDAAPAPSPAPADTDLSHVALQVRLEPGRPALLPLVVVGGGGGLDVDRVFAELVAAPARPWVDNATHFREFLFRGTMELLAPDPAFENAFKWAKVGIESLRAAAPGIGSSLASGYGSGGATAEWLGTPNALGGTGALWAAMAADAYGDRPAAADTLRLMARFQAVDGRIPAAVGSDGQVIESAATPTALFLIALHNHVRTWGDRQLLTALWPAAQRAVDFLYAADGNGDGLLSAHGRRDRWSEDTAVQTPIDLAALWGAALEATQQLAVIMGDAARAERASETVARVRTILNDPFFNPTSRRFNFAKRNDGSFVPAGTVLPAVPMIFRLLDAGPAGVALDALSSSAFTRDWGVALVGHSPEAAPNPEGDRTAAPAPPGLPAAAADVVSPIFTGWTALAEYANDRSVAGFAHTATNLLLLQHGNPGYATAAYERAGFTPRPGIPQSAAAQAMTLLPVVWGMLGIRPDAINRTISISPQLPVGWRGERWARVVLNQVRVGNSEFRLQIRRSPTQIRFQVDLWRGDRDVVLRFTQHVPTDVAIALDPAGRGFEVITDDTREETGRRAYTVAVRPAPNTTTSILTINHDDYPRLMPPAQLQAGRDQTSGGLRIIRTRYLGGVLTIAAEGLPSQTYTLTVTTPWPVSQVTGVPGARVSSPGEGLATIDVDIPGSGSRYRPIDLQVTFNR